METAKEHGHLDSIPTLFRTLRSVTRFESLRACVFLQTGVVVSELLTSLPNLSELVCLSCINAFDESKLSGVQSWHFFDGNYLRAKTLQMPQMSPPSTGMSAHNEHDLSPLDQTLAQGALQSPQLQAVEEPVASTRTMTILRVAVWTRTRLSDRRASHLAELPSSSSNGPSTNFDEHESGLLDAVSLYMYRSAGAMHFYWRRFVSLFISAYASGFFSFLFLFHSALFVLPLGHCVVHFPLTILYS